MAHNADGLITSPVRMKEDVRYVLFGDTSSNFKLSVLNTTTNINKWSKVKPMGNATWGLNVIRQTQGSGIKAMYENANNWAFVAPDNSAQWPYKLVAHFTNYLHTARIIADVNISPSQYFVEDTEMVFVQADFTNQTYALNILDFLNIVNPQGTHLYFGVVIHGPSDTWTLIRNSYALGVDTTQTSTESGKWHRGINLTSRELPFLAGYQATIYPVVTTDYQSDPTPKTTGDIAINGNGITLPVSPVTVESITIISYLFGFLSGISITKSTNAYYATFTYSVQNNSSRSYTFPSQTATFYLCSRVSDPSGYQGWQILGTFSASISSFTVGANSTVSRTITQLWSSASDPLVISAADTSVAQLKVFLAMPDDVANAGPYDVEATASLTRIAITTFDDPISIHDPAVQWGITAYWSDGTTSNPSSILVGWYSTDTSKATVNYYGYVTGISAGVVTIYASYLGESDFMTVYVRSLVTGVTLNKNSMTLNTGESERLTATVSPSDATDQRLNWSSSNSSIASVDSNGNVTGVGAGTCTITATTVDGGYTASCQVTVVHAYMEVWRHNTSTGDEYVITSYTYTRLNTYINLFAKVYNKDYPNGSTSGFSWSLPSGQNVVSMSDYSSYKRFTATNNGSTTLTVRHSSGLSENITLTVDDPNV